MSVAALARSSAVHVAFAFLAMGGWAVFANRAHGMPAPLIAGIVQGALSGTITFFLKRGIEFLATRLGGMAALLGPPLAAFVVSLTLLSAIHAGAGTPEIPATIAVPLTVATSYAAIYNWGLWTARETHS